MNLDIAICLFCAYSLIMKKRNLEICDALETAAIDGGFRLTYNERYGIIAHDLHGKIKPFAVSFNGGKNKKDPFADLEVVAEPEHKPSSPQTCSVLEEGLRFG
jgi:hypothetical protein|tara:strand:+ start:176 stop:484 length:309 start_codon:yes stop_codon:yes gene_type:complete